VDAADVVRAFPELGARRVVPLPGGWDFDAFDVDDEWIVRVPKRAEVRDWLRTEVALLPELKPALSVPVPHVALVNDHGAAFTKLRGNPLTSPSDAAADALGRALSELHSFPVERGLAVGVPDLRGDRWRERHDRRWNEWRQRVLPLLGGDERATAERRAARFRARLDQPLPWALVHGDLGPAHVLCVADRLTGLIDWADAKVGDPAIDLAWPLHGLGDAFAARLLRAYGAADGDLRRRARFYHLIGPFYEVVYGLDEERPELVESGLAGIRRRLG
jgi:aminoglycoside phosphotransferase (APT) family kinase protein